MTTRKPKIVGLDREPPLPTMAALIGRNMDEATFQRQVVNSLQNRGWWTFTVPANVKKCYGCGRLIQTWTNPGWPDVFAVKGGRIIYFELKSRTGQVSPEQRAVHAMLRETGQEVYVLRSTEWDRFIRIIEEGPE